MQLKLLKGWDRLGGGRFGHFCNCWPFFWPLFVIFLAILAIIGHFLGGATVGWFWLFSITFGYFFLPVRCFWPLLATVGCFWLLSMAFWSLLPHLWPLLIAIGLFDLVWPPFTFFFGHFWPFSRFLAKFLKIFYFSAISRIKDIDFFRPLLTVKVKTQPWPEACDCQ